MTINKTAHLRAPQRKRGFTLTEIAIVLGIMGLILGAVWTAASTVYANQKNTKLDQEVLSAVQGIRALYATSLNTGDAAGTNITAALVNANIFPADLVNGATVMTPWGSATTLTVTTETISSGSDAVMFELSSVPKAGCVAFLTGQTASTGLTYANVPAAAKVGTTVTITTPGITIPITATAASTACSGATNFIDIAYPLKG